MKLAELSGYRGTHRPPVHVAIIMDGNARWARQRGLGVMEGHRKGAEKVWEAIRDARRLGIRYLTLYAFSTENWKRPVAEIEGLWVLLREFCHRAYGRLRDDGVELRAIGDVARLPEELQTLLARCQADPPEDVKLTVTLALSYGGRDEIVRAVRKLAARGHDLTRLTEAELSAALDTAGVPDPDVIVRTAGERRLSNFLPWQGIYSELVTCPQMWPEASAVRVLRPNGSGRVASRGLRRFREIIS